ncbi:MAG: thiamine pyrophosphate-dependent dehydrogenase E1 component subunit alpha [Verrucomicrobiae bacterium]|nr:thiamine pyrophosphate-dependent dehydrogenase E1 component subunit alpha [Verrucomicrobiae bacterium]
MTSAPATFNFADPYSKEFLLRLYERMVLVRQFEEGVKFLFLEGTMPGTIHQCQGQEAAAVGVCFALNKNDFIASTHRPHGHALAKGLTPEEILLELFGGNTGCCKGKGGSMHIGDMSKGMIPAIAIVGGGIPVAAGMALAFKLQKTSQVAACFFGDGATSEGAFHEGVTLAAIWNLPVLFVCENNFYGASTHISKVTRLKTLAERAAGYGIRGETVDGNDVLAVYEAARQAIEECRGGKGPVLLELLTYRITGHSRRDPCLYQPKEEKESWQRREPIGAFARRLAQCHGITEAELEPIRAKVDRQLAVAVAQARQAPKPSVAELTTHVFGNSK